MLINDAMLLLDYLQHIFLVVCFFFNDTATTEIYTLSLHDALPIRRRRRRSPRQRAEHIGVSSANPAARSEEHTSELQSHSDFVCRLLLEKKKITLYALCYYCECASHHLVPIPRVHVLW